MYYNSRNLVDEVSARGCLSHLPDSQRSKCDSKSLECHKCLSDMCNNMGREDFKCIECDSSKVSNYIYVLVDNYKF